MQKPQNQRRLKPVKRIPWAIALSLLCGCSFSGCAAVRSWWWNVTDTPPRYDIPVLQYDEASVAGIMHWTRDNIGFASDDDLYGYGEYWATPEETYRARAGDCEDYAILALWLLWRDLDIRGDLVTSRSVYDGTGHTMVDVSGTLWQPQLGIPAVAERYEEIGRAPVAEVLTYTGRAYPW